MKKENQSEGEAVIGNKTTATHISWMRGIFDNFFAWTMCISCFPMFRHDPPWSQKDFTLG